jgi:hypothetical protein
VAHRVRRRLTPRRGRVSALLVALLAGSLTLLPLAHADPSANLALRALLRASDLEGRQTSVRTEGPFRTIDGFLHATLGQAAARRQERPGYTAAGFQQGALNWVRGPVMSWSSTTVVVRSPEAATQLVDFIHDYYVSNSWSVVADGITTHAFRIMPRGVRHPADVAIVSWKGNVIVSIDAYRTGGANAAVIRRALARMLARVPSPT